MTTPHAIPQPSPTQTPTQAPTPETLYGPLPEPAPTRKPSRLEVAIAKARAEIDYEPEWFWQLHRMNPGNQIGAAIPAARQDGLDYDHDAAAAALAGQPGTYIAALCHDGRPTPVFRRPPFTIDAPPAAPAPAPLAPANFNADKIAAYVTAGAAALATLRDLFAPRDALTVKDLLPLMQKQQERTPVAELIEGIEAIRRVSGSPEAAESSGELAEVIRAAAPAIIEAFTRRPAPQPQPRRLIQQQQPTHQQRPALATPTPPTETPAAQSGAAGATTPDPSTVPPIAQAIGFGAANSISPEAIAPALFDIIRGPDENATRETAVNIQAAGAAHYAAEWTAETPALSLCADYTQATAEALAELAADVIQDLDDDDEAPADREYAAFLARSKGHAPGAALIRAIENPAPVAQEAPQGGKDAPAGANRPGLDIPGPLDDDGSPREGNPHTAPRMTIHRGPFTTVTGPAAPGPAPDDAPKPRRTKKTKTQEPAK